MELDATSRCQRHAAGFRDEKKRVSKIDHLEYYIVNTQGGFCYEVSLGHQAHLWRNHDMRGQRNGHLFRARVVFRRPGGHCHRGVRLDLAEMQKLKGEVDMKVYCVKPPRLIRAILKMFLKDQ